MRHIDRTFPGVFSAFCLLGLSLPAVATPIAYNGFSGNETLINFNGFTGSQGISFTTAGATFTNTHGFDFIMQSGLSSFFSNYAGASGDPSLFDRQGATWNTDFTAAFSTPVKRVGMLLASSYPNDPYQLEAYDASGGLIETVFGSTPSTPQQAIFLGVEETVNIGHIHIYENTINDSGTLIDDVRFENVPEPTALPLIAAAGLTALRRRKRA
jgi:hypothetical protein